MPGFGFGLLAPFSQTGVMQPLTGRSHAANHGACHNFTIDWLHLMFQNDTVDPVDPKESRKRMTTLAKGRGGGNPVLQAAFSRRWAEGDMKVADEMMIKLRGLKEKGIPIDYTHFNYPKLKTTIVDSPKYGGFIYSFWFAGSTVGATGGAHTIGFYRNMTIGRGKLSKSTDYSVCYDPNYGELYVPDAQFVTFYNWIVASYAAFLFQFCKGVDSK